MTELGSTWPDYLLLLTPAGRRVSAARPPHLHPAAASPGGDSARRRQTAQVSTLPDLAGSRLDLPGFPPSMPGPQFMHSFAHSLMQSPRGSHTFQPHFCVQAPQSPHGRARVPPPRHLRSCWEARGKPMLKPTECAGRLSDMEGRRGPGPSRARVWGVALHRPPAGPLRGGGF